MKNVVFVLGLFVLCSASSVAQNTFLTTKYGNITTAWDTTRVAATTTSTKARILITNDSATPTDTLFYAFNSKLNDTSATKSVGIILPGESEEFGVVGLYMVNLKGKSTQARRLRILTNIPGY